MIAQTNTAECVICPYFLNCFSPSKETGLYKQELYENLVYTWKSMMMLPCIFLHATMVKWIDDTDKT